MARWLTAACLLTATGLLAGCGAGDDLPPREKTFAQARAVATGVADAAAGPGARLGTPRGEGNPSLLACTSSDALPPGTPITGEYFYRVEGARAGRGGDHLGRAAAYLRRTGWKQGPVNDLGALGFDKRGFSLVVRYSRVDQVLTVDVETPCVAPADPDDPLAQ